MEDDWWFWYSRSNNSLIVIACSDIIVRSTLYIQVTLMQGRWGEL